MPKIAIQDISMKSLHTLRLAAVLGLLFLSFTGTAQLEAYPPHWYRGFEHDTLEILLFSPREMKKLPVIEGEVTVVDVSLASNPQYAYITVVSGEGEPIDFKIKAASKSLQYELRGRSPYEPKGLSPEDAIYLITPDRFANADPENDKVEGMNEQVYSRDSAFGRHGGDIQGIIDHLDYIKDLGFTSLWISPLLENDQEQASYHGYAITDHFRIDPRFGDNELYEFLVHELHERDMKMVRDVVYNHFGSQHQLFQNPPDSGFFHWHDEYLQTNYRAVNLFDPHASNADSTRFSDGWFDGHMPDVNQRNPHMANFLIQQSIWSIEEFGIDAFRIDTYTYPDLAFMGKLAKRIRDEYEDFFLFGETWVHGPEIQSYFVEENPFNPISTHMQSVTDFQLAFAIQEALTRPQGWTDGMAKVYYRLAADYLYKDPSVLVTFLDNHDLARIYGSLGKDVDKLKVALGMLFTIRGIPCMYYGTEIGMSKTENHGVIREDFPGGWPDDPVDKFTRDGRTEEENEIFNFVENLLEWRDNSEAVTEGKMMHFIPENGVYAYFRYVEDEENEKVMVLVNTSGEPQKVDLSRFSEIWPQGTPAINVLSDTKLNESSLNLEPMSITIAEQVKEEHY